MSARALIKTLAPPLLLSLLQRYSGRAMRYAGHSTDWSQALSMSSGYAATSILERVTEATRAVVSGRARYERDAVLFTEAEHPFALLAALWRAAALGGGRLDVVDFGGSLGSSYRQSRPLLDGLQQLQWRVVEQPAFVATGQREFSTDELSFTDSLESLPPCAGVRVVLASSVLQYLNDPYAVLDAFTGVGAEHLIIDRTPMSGNPTDRLCIQHVPKQIYAASYPCWILSKSKLLERLSRNWHLVCDFPCADGTARTDDGVPFEFRGLVLERSS